MAQENQRRPQLPRRRGAEPRPPGWPKAPCLVRGVRVKAQPMRALVRKQRLYQDPAGEYWIGPQQAVDERCQGGISAVYKTPRDQKLIASECRVGSGTEYEILEMVQITRALQVI
jgi:hypothetical protein